MLVFKEEPSPSDNFYLRLTAVGSDVHVTTDMGSLLYDQYSRLPSTIGSAIAFVFAVRYNNLPQKALATSLQTNHQSYMEAAAADDLMIEWGPKGDLKYLHNPNHPKSRKKKLASVSSALMFSIPPKNPTQAQKLVPAIARSLWCPVGFCNKTYDTLTSIVMKITGERL